MLSKVALAGQLFRHAINKPVKMGGEVTRAKIVVVDTYRRSVRHLWVSVDVDVKNAAARSHVEDFSKV